jgi:hypothetical protein
MNHFSCRNRCQTVITLRTFLSVLLTSSMFTGFRVHKSLLLWREDTFDQQLQDEAMMQPRNNNNQTTTIRRTTTGDSFSFCVLLKDDNDILNEWIAYHYHTLNLRHLIVAIDPSSATSPSSLFETWRTVFGDIRIDEWNDDDYMPEYFLKGKYDLVPSFIPTAIQQNRICLTQGLYTFADKGGLSKSMIVD